MKVTYDGRAWYTIHDLAALVFLPYQSVYVMARRDRVIPPPNHKICGNRDYYSAEEVVELEKFFEKFRNKKLKAKQLREANQFDVTFKRVAKDGEKK